MEQEIPKVDLLIIDGNNFLFKALHVGDVGLTDQDGNPTSGLTIAIKMLVSYMEKYDPMKILFVWDKGRCNFRKKLLESIGVDYKGKRAEKTPEEKLAIDFTFKNFKSWLLMLGIESIGSVDLEADDLVYQAAMLPKFSDLKILISSSDKDLYQALENPNVSILTFKDTIFTLDDFKLKYPFLQKVTDYAKFKAIVGDKSDNMGGVQGLGESFASGLFALTSNPLAFCKQELAKGENKKYQKLVDNEKIYLTCFTATTLKHKMLYDFSNHFKSYSDADYEGMYELAVQYSLLESYLNRIDRISKVIERYKQNEKSFCDFCRE